MRCRLKSVERFPNGNKRQREKTYIYDIRPGSLLKFVQRGSVRLTFQQCSYTMAYLPEATVLHGTGGRETMCATVGSIPDCSERPTTSRSGLDPSLLPSVRRLRT